jgi:hypothetical protein
MLSSDMCLSPSAAAINSSIVGRLESKGAFIWISSVHGSSEPREVASGLDERVVGRVPRAPSESVGGAESSETALYGGGMETFAFLGNVVG